MGLVVTVIPFWTNFRISQASPTDSLTPVSRTTVGNTQIVYIPCKLVKRTLLFASSIKVGRVDGIGPVDSVSVGRAL